MKYYIDFEFSEYFKRNIFGKKKHIIDLISVGIISEDGRTYYAISNEFSKYDCNKWVRENVLPKLDSNIERKTNKQIAAEIFDFVNPDLGYSIEGYNNSDFRDKDSEINKYFDLHAVTDINGHYYANPKFVTYYGAYDWVLFCSLFGTMSDLPPGFPMYSIDLKQSYDELESDINKPLKTLEGYPIQNDEHNALSDAIWNKELDEFLDTL